MGSEMCIRDRARGVEFSLLLQTPEGMAHVCIARQTEFARIIDHPAPADVTVKASREALEARMNGETSQVELTGEASVFDRWIDLHDRFDLWFRIATP